jgi:hypothetical protein
MVGEGAGIWGKQAHWSTALASEKVFMRELKDAMEGVGSLSAMVDRLQEDLRPTVSYHFMIHRLIGQF